MVCQGSSQGEGWEQEEGTCPGRPAEGGLTGLRIIFSDEVQKMKENSEPFAVDHNATLQGHRDWTCVTSRSMEAQAVESFSERELLQILVLPNGRAKTPHKQGTGHKTAREGRQCRPSPIIKNFFVSLFAVVHAAAKCADRMAQSARSLHPQRSSS